MIYLRNRSGDRGREVFLLCGNCESEILTDFPETRPEPTVLDLAMEGLRHLAECRKDDAPFRGLLRERMQADDAAGWVPLLTPWGPATAGRPFSAEDGNQEVVYADKFVGAFPTTTVKAWASAAAAAPSRFSDPLVGLPDPDENPPTVQRLLLALGYDQWAFHDAIPQITQWLETHEPGPVLRAQLAMRGFRALADEPETDPPAEFLCARSVEVTTADSGWPDGALLLHFDAEPRTTWFQPGQWRSVTWSSDGTARVERS